jgi:hypothetical protein
MVALAVLLSIIGGACNRSASPPAPLPVEQVPAALEKAFSKAKAEPKQLAGEVAVAVQGQDYPKALLRLQALVSQSGLSKEQVSVTSRAMLTINELLQQAQARGDANAAQTLKTIRENK